MFLKRLDVVGFKSFAERISIDFVTGVTAVVGPNGSGKSNITDAIRWVLGEQSAKSLRGSKMEDIIFAGSDSRKSLNVAEVSLTLDNEDKFFPIDYQEICVTRRVYRSGESEFFINKQSCRLKDIVDLFMDSGLGREAFSIISQGRVEEILSSKPEERRTIFEEAAGVLKYKHRKKKAEQKLSETQENLNRVEDIIYELEGQLEPLEIQASIARDYLEKRHELEQVEVAITVHEIEEAHQKWEKHKQDFEHNRDREIELGTDIQAKEAEIEGLKETIQALDESIDDLQEVLLVASKELEKLEGRKEVLKERKKNYHQNREGYKRKIEEYKSKMEDYASMLVEERKLLNRFKDELSAIQQQLSQKQSELELADLNIEEALENLKSEYIEILNEQAAHRNELKHLESQLEQQLTKNDRLDEDYAKYLSKRTEIDQKKAEITRRLEVQQKQMEEDITTYRSLQRKLEDRKREYQTKESKLYQAYQYLQQFRSKKEVLEDMQEDYAGFFQGVKEVLKARDEILPGVEGAIAELLSVPKEYETAIEIALGSATQHVVTDNEHTARKAIDYLKKNRFGRATFLPLAVIKGKLFPSDQLHAIRTHPGFVGIAKDLVNYEAKYEVVIANLLGHVVITKDLKSANDLAKVLNYRFRLVTLEGDVVNPGGSMTGGSVKQKSTSLLGRQRELEQLTEKYQEMEQKTNELEIYVKSLKGKLAQDEIILEELREKGSQNRLIEQQLKSDLREIELEEKNINERLALYDHEMAATNEDRSAAQKRMEERKQDLDRLTETAKSLEEKMNQLSQQKSEQQASKDQLQVMLTDLKVQLAEKQQITSNQEEKIERLVQESAEIKETLDEAQEEFFLLEDEMTSNSSGEEKLEIEITGKRKENEETVSLISKRREERLLLSTKMSDIDKELKELKRQHKQLFDLLRDEEVRINRLDVELENKLTYLREEYMLTFEAAKEQYQLTIPYEEAKTRVKLIKLAIEELGTVNLGAIEEFERISERFSFLQEQRDDLVEAKTTLHQVISEMDEEMTRRFEETFYTIRSHFETVFVQLFGGGRADLVLTDPEDLLNTGVDIVAQPPGKKLQNLSLLSGGERALTAIALLFAILRVRPVPFCVLDEVEAALDEANVARFAQYLKKLSHESQFIVITHRKGTMEEADVLYGVTMQESGVSKLVSVRLEESRQLVEQT